MAYPFCQAPNTLAVCTKCLKNNLKTSKNIFQATTLRWIPRPSWFSCWPPSWAFLSTSGCLYCRKWPSGTSRWTPQNRIHFQPWTICNESFTRIIIFLKFLKFLRYTINYHFFNSSWYTIPSQGPFWSTPYSLKSQCKVFDNLTNYAQNTRSVWLKTMFRHP